MTLDFTNLFADVLKGIEPSKELNRILTMPKRDALMRPEDVLPARIAAKVEVDPSGCWLWTASCLRDGYGSTLWRGRTQGAHRAVWEIVYGEIPPHDSHHGMCVCHHCDVRSCVNPDHLFLGTQTANMRDCRSKSRLVLPGPGTAPKGEANGHAKLSARDVDQIRALRGIESQTSVGARFGISQPAVSRIQRGLRWSHVE